MPLIRLGPLTPMPPKKDDKKGGGKAPPKEVDPALYKRAPLVFEELPGDLVSPSLSGEIINVETLFPEWTIDGEDWTAGVEEDKTEELQFPDHIDITSAEFKSLKALLVQETEEAAGDKKGGKKDAKKGAPAAVEMVEPPKDEAGNLLPRMFLDSNFDAEDFEPSEEEPTLRKYNWPFVRVFSKDQLERKV